MTKVLTLLILLTLLLELLSSVDLEYLQHSVFESNIFISISLQIVK